VSYASGPQVAGQQLPTSDTSLISTQTVRHLLAPEIGQRGIMSAGIPSAILISNLRRQMERALGSVAPSKPFALLDFPDYPNVGDSAIWLGTIDYFRHVHGREPAYVCSKSSVDWNALARAIPDGTLFLQGGGNFGDLWPRQQEFREEVVRRFPHHRIVQLPQSIHFDNRANLVRARDVINAHRDFHLFVRDRNSYAIATNAFNCPVQLCPDMAFGLRALPTTTPPVYERVFLLRTDKESRSAGTAIGEVSEHCAQFDWAEDPYLLARRTKLRAILSSWRCRDLQQLRAIYYRRLAEARLNRGVKLLAMGRSVVTDRLHGHILCVMLGIPHVAMDNSYGKISNFIATWTTDCDLVDYSDKHDGGFGETVAQRSFRPHDDAAPVSPPLTKAESVCGPEI
jgi:exopolysaccharide biosynthesis protein PssK